MRGRIMSIYQLLFAGTTPFGSLIIGGLAERWGVQQATMLVAVICGLGVLLAFAYLRRNASGLLPDEWTAESETRPATAPLAPAAVPLGK